ncbi:MAG TPA: hypothetical protein VIV40_01285, partial [Kofleriaceae bacterium]
ASGSKSVAAVLLFFCVIFGIAMLGALGDDSDKTKDSAENAGRIVGMLLFAGVPGAFGFRAARNASRAGKAGKLATTEPSYSFRLSGKYIIVADGNGAPRPELSFKINRKLRTMLLAVPRAEVVEHNRPY